MYSFFDLNPKTGKYELLGSSKGADKAYLKANKVYNTDYDFGTRTLQPRGSPDLFTGILTLVNGNEIRADYTDSKKTKVVDYKALMHDRPHCYFGRLPFPKYKLFHLVDINNMETYKPKPVPTTTTTPKPTPPKTVPSTSTTAKIPTRLPLQRLLQNLPLTVTLTPTTPKPTTTTPSKITKKSPTTTSTATTSTTPTSPTTTSPKTRPTTTGSGPKSHVFSDHSPQVLPTCNQKSAKLTVTCEFDGCGDKKTCTIYVDGKPKAGVDVNVLGIKHFFY
ncbi:hypothetical protein L596_028825 [Steinernema carpocapsae]|uniref:Uncharacterized protein n=1 Tax=Steinernema carpocapsae TaxID=34508 RepID=A0A4U5LZK0_STECR|nr:hypothetical protein L596_028825 [Steinernema carpocapsae]